MPYTENSSAIQLSNREEKRSHLSQRPYSEQDFIDYLTNSESLKNQISKYHKTTDELDEPFVNTSPLSQIFSTLSSSYQSDNSSSSSDVYRAFSQADEGQLYNLYERLVVPEIDECEFQIPLTIENDMKDFLKRAIAQAVHDLLDIHGHLKKEISDLLGITQVLPAPTTTAYRSNIIFPLMYSYVSHVIVGGILTLYHDKNEHNPLLAKSFAIPSNIHRLLEDNSDATDGLITHFFKHEIAINILNQSVFSEPHFYQFSKTLRPEVITDMVTSDIFQAEKDDELCIQADLAFMRMDFWSNLKRDFQSENDIARSKSIHDGFDHKKRSGCEEQKTENTTQPQLTQLWLNARDNQSILDSLIKISSKQKFKNFLTLIKEDKKQLQQPTEQFIQSCFADKQFIQTYKDDIIDALAKLHARQLKKRISLVVLDGDKEPLTNYLKLNYWDDIIRILTSTDKKNLSVAESTALKTHRDELLNKLLRYVEPKKIEDKFKILQKTALGENPLGELLQSHTSTTGAAFSLFVTYRTQNIIKLTKIVEDLKAEMDSKEQTLCPY